MSYKEAIDILARNPDLAGIAIEVAKCNPSAFVAAAERLRYALPKWKVTACRLYETQDKITACKFVKDDRGWDLMTAKRAVEKLVQEYGLKKPV